MKIIPANQSLILAGESPFLGQGSRLVAGGPALPRVSVVATRTEATVIIQDLPPSGAARRPLQLYTRTQRGFEDPRATALLDVFA